MANNQLQLVTFEQAKKLKEAGFDWETHKGYDKRGLVINLWVEEFGMKIPHTKAPEVALALKWMRDVKGLLGVVSHSDDIGHWYGIKDMSNGGVTTFNRCYETYERAESALLDELLTLVER